MTFRLTITGQPPIELNSTQLQLALVGLTSYTLEEWVVGFGWVVT